MRTKAKAAVAFGSMVVVACGGSSGAHPTDMSAAGHENAAAQQEQLANLSAAQYDPNAVTTTTKCAGGAETRPCWTTTSNPTAGQAQEVAEHRKLAAEHRAASKALRDAEEAACKGLNDADRDLSPFEHRADIMNVEEIHERSTSSRQAGVLGPLEGASVTLRAVPGLTKEYLQRLVSCHLARDATMGFAMPEMAWCPLSVKGASATVESAGSGFRVDIKGDSKDSAEEIARRAKGLMTSK